VNVRESNARVPSSDEGDMDGRGRPTPAGEAGERGSRARLRELLGWPKAPDALREKIRRLLAAEVRRTGDSIEPAQSPTR
jgi:hypothetical protein